MKTLLSLAVLIPALGFANVAGSKSEVFGTQWKHADYKTWLTDSDSIITPEFSRFATQACLRTSQEELDLAAYSKVRSLVAAMQTAYANPSNRETSQESRKYEEGLNALTSILLSLDETNEPDAEAYEKKCEAIVGGAVAKMDTQSALLPLYYGRFFPGISPNLPVETQNRLKKMLAKGLQLSPLTWNKYVEQVCKLEGYYSTSFQQELWKFFSITRALGNVLPNEREDGLLRETLEESPEVIKLLTAINQYSSVAGRINGPTVGMVTDSPAPNVRMTGVAFGSIATSPLALFTTGWREEIQRLVIEQEYPENPFQLISAQSVLASLAKTKTEILTRKSPSQSELGMAGLLQGRNDDYGPETAAIRTTYALAWLALNAETNIRQNEKITGFERASVGEPQFVKAPIFGTRSQFEGIANEIGAAKKAYFAIIENENRLPYCLTQMENLNLEAAKSLGDAPKTAELSPDLLAVLLSLKMEPVIADIGMEINDELGNKPEGLFRLHLATGFGHKAPVSVEGKSYSTWIPSSMVLHLDKLVSTAQWRSEVENFDPAN